jgi:hypothetical protein
MSRILVALLLPALIGLAALALPASDAAAGTGCWTKVKRFSVSFHDSSPLGQCVIVIVQNQTAGVTVAEDGGHAVAQAFSGGTALARAEDDTAVAHADQGSESRAIDASIAIGKDGARTFAKDGVAFADGEDTTAVGRPGKLQCSGPGRAMALSTSGICFSSGSWLNVTIPFGP